MKYIFILSVILLSCNDESFTPFETIRIEVVALSDDCTPKGTVVNAVVDSDDILDTAFPFDCIESKGSVKLSARDTLEIRVFNSDQFDKTVRYKITVTQSSHVEQHDSVSFTGIKFIVK
jgi:hypothetical protein